MSRYTSQAFTAWAFVARRQRQIRVKMGGRLIRRRQSAGFQGFVSLVAERDRNALIIERMAKKFEHRRLLKGVNQWKAAWLNLANDQMNGQMQREREMAQMNEAQLTGQLEAWRECGLAMGMSDLE